MYNYEEYKIINEFLSLQNLKHLSIPAFLLGAGFGVAYLIHRILQRDKEKNMLSNEIKMKIKNEAPKEEIDKLKDKLTVLKNDQKDDYEKLNDKKEKVKEEKEKEKEKEKTNEERALIFNDIKTFNKNSYYLFEEISLDELEKQIEKDKKDIQYKPKYFSMTWYNLPTESQLEDLNDYKMNAEQIYTGFCYTCIGRGVVSLKNIKMIQDGIQMLIDKYPDNIEYKKALELTSELKPRYERLMTNIRKIEK